MAPSIEVIAMDQEGVMAASPFTGGISDYSGNNGGVFGSQAMRTHGPIRELEDLINDILTTER